MQEQMAITQQLDIREGQVCDLCRATNVVVVPGVENQDDVHNAGA